MSTIHELLTEQESLLNALYWCSEDDENKSSIEGMLDCISVQGEEKIKFLSGIYLEAKAKSDAIKLTMDSLKKRLDTSRYIEDRLKNLMLDTMQLVNAKSVECKYIKITKCLGQEVVVYPENFQPERLPDDLVKVTITHSPIASAVKDYVREYPENFLNLKLHRSEYLRIV